MSLVSIIGIDNNGKNALFAIGLLNQETKENYLWFLEQFFECMKNVISKHQFLFMIDEEASVENIIEFIPEM